MSTDDGTNEVVLVEAWQTWNVGVAGEPGPDHPAGDIQVAPNRRFGVRAALLAGYTTAVTAGVAVTAMMTEPGTTGHTGGG
jgi:hypothetical protein